MVKKHFIFTPEDIANGKYSVWDLMQPLWFTVSIYDGIDVYNENLRHFTQGQRRILALMWYDSEVSNGGHEQFFGNSTGIVWKDAIEGMHMIGAQKIAENFQKAIDDWYYDNDAMDDLMDEYVKNHPEEFVVDGEYDYFE